MGRSFVAGLVLLAACADQPPLYVDPPWPPDRLVILVEHDDREAAVAVRAFAPGAPMMLTAVEGQRVSLTAITYLPTDDPERDPIRCGVKLGSDNPIALEPDAAYHAPTADWSEMGAPLFQGIDPKTLDLPLSYTTCSTDPFDCTRLDIEKIAGIHTDGKFRSIAAADDDLVFYAASEQTDLVPFDFRLYRAFLPRSDAPAQRLLSRPTELSYRVKSLAFDGTSIIGRTEDGLAFASTLDGVMSYTASIAAYKNVASRGGVTCELGLGGAHCLAGSVAPLLVPTTAMAIVSADRIVAATDVGLQYWDGQRWTVELALTSGNGWTVGGDADVFVAAHADGTILERDEANGAWRDLDHPLGAFTDLRAAIGLGGGRWLIAGQDGLFGIKLAQGRICRAPVIGANNYEGLALSPSGRTVWLGMSPNASVLGDRVVLVRFTLPQPR